MKLVLISDTHGLHDQVILPKGDILLHTGDVSKRGYREEIVDFIKWFRKQPFKYKVFISGNHDFFFETVGEKELQELTGDDITYLNDSGITIEGLNIWGSPVQPRFFDWAFNRDRGADINKHWQLIPADTDVLLTHGPPMGILDKTDRGEQVGCEMLLKKIKEVQPQLSVFGHIHEDYGMKEVGKTTFVNASVVNLQYRVVNDPVVVDLG